jgi:CRISPR-associated protein (TIGR03984 family)
MPNKGLRLLRVSNKPVKTQKGDWNKIRGTIDEQYRGKRAGTFVLMHHFACIGIYENGEFIMPSSIILEPWHIRTLRVFDENSECYVWKNSHDEMDIFRLRIRCDEENDDEALDVVEARQLLWGTSLENYGTSTDWKLLKEKRGIEIIIHSSFIPQGFQISSRQRLWLVTCNYVGYTDIGQAGYIDSRFVRIEG